MVFTLVSAAQEWLNIKSDEIRRAAELQEQQRLIEEEEAERVKQKIITNNF